MLVPQAKAMAAEPAPSPAANRPYSKILVVDDDPMNVKLVMAILKKEGYECLTAFGGAEALRQARQQVPDLVMLDIMMPEIDGYQVTRELRHDSTTAEIPIIMITALNGSEDKVRALECGADEFLTKPVNAAELLARTKSMLRLKQYRDQLNLRTRSEKAFGTREAPEVVKTAARRRPCVLLVEDNEKDRLLFSRQIENQDCDLSVAKDGEAGLQKVLAGGVDLVLLDIFLPGINGFDVCQRIKAHCETRNVQVLLITCLGDLEGKIKGMELGADDYLVKPIDGRELGARIKALLAKKSYLDQLHAHYEHAVSSAISDGLTGLYNQTYLKQFLALELKRSSRQGYPTSLLMLDLDNFKQLNDRFGHPTGDAVLKQIAGLIRTCIREVDLAARYGGEEFTVVLPYADINGARTVAGRIQMAIGRHTFTDDQDRPLGTVTASIGMAVASKTDEDAASLIRQADQMLYQAKAYGKNRIAPAA
jgi:two-component system cell cycle response regulator